MFVVPISIHLESIRMCICVGSGYFVCPVPPPFTDLEADTVKAG